jgi:hypothetical protein
MKSLRSAGSGQAPRALQVVGMTLEEIHVGQHGQAGRAMGGVAFGGLRHEVFAQHALRRRGLLDLGDHAGVAGGDLVAQRALEAARGHAGFVAQALGLGAQARQVALLARGCHLIGLHGQDLFQDVGLG